MFFAIAEARESAAAPNRQARGRLHGRRSVNMRAFVVLMVPRLRADAALSAR